MTVTALARVRRARVALAAVIVVRGIVWGVAATLATRAVVGVLAGRIDAAWALSVLAGALVAGAMLWRGRAAWSVERTALWIEARAPELQYALVTAIEPRAAHAEPALRRVVAAIDIDRMVCRAAAPAVGWALAGAAVGAGLLAVMPMCTRARFTLGGPPSRVAAGAPNRLATLVARVAPPGYTRQSPREIHDPTTITAYVGSTVDLIGRGPSMGVRATLGADSAPVAADGSTWRVRLAMPGRSAVVRLRDRGYERIVALDAVLDRPPTVTLDRPPRDSTLRTATGALIVEARAADDIGLRDGYFELIVSAGDEEGSFRSAERRIGATEFGDAPSASMGARIDLAAIGLTPGGRLSVRAVVRDDNALSGPGVGTSETRTFRVAQLQEYDSVAVEGELPPALDSTYLSQRMIVIRTRELRQTAPRLPRDSVVRRASALSDAEEQLRERVQSLLNGPDEGDGGGPLLLPDWQRALFDTAFQALADASADLRTATLRAALGPELIALRVLDRARVAGRLYLRGAQPTIVVNTARVRLAGHDKPDAAPRMPEPRDDTSALAALPRLEAIARRASGAPSAMVDSIAVLRLAVAGTWPAASAALGDAADAIRAHRDPHLALSRARRAIVGVPSVAEGLPAWDGGAH